MTAVDPGGRGARTRVSVVVPVYNPGPALEPCIASLLGQTMPRDEFEIILVDDGSTDGTAARLDEIEAAEPNVRVIHIPGSGAPGRPRNVGLAAARGTYVQFLDDDDALAPRALEWLTRMADRNDSDVVIGKYASATLDRSQAIFTHSRNRASLADTPDLLTASWGPAKLFRVATLRDAGITFPEGWRWMEDQLFVLRAYFAARNISVFADAPCYFFARREEGGHLSGEQLDPDARASHLGDVFDLIEAQAPPGPLRDQLIRRFYRANILSTFDERYLAASPASQERIFERFSDFATTRVGRPIDDTFTGVNRARARLLRTGDAARMLAFTRRLADLEVRVSARQLRWRGGRLLVDVTAALRHRSDGTPLTVVIEDGTATLDPELTADVGERVLADVDGMRARVSLRDAVSAVEWIVPSASAVLLRDAARHPGGGRRQVPAVAVAVEIDPRHVGPAGMRLARGRWSVSVRWRGLGVKGTGLLHEPAGAFRPLLPRVVGDPPTLIVPRFGEDGLSIEVGATGLSSSDWRSGEVAVIRDGRSLEVALPVLAGRGVGRRPATILLRGPDGDREWPADVAPDLGRLRLRSRGGDFGAASRDPADRLLFARLGPPVDLEVPLGVARFDGAGGVRVVGASTPGILDRARARVSWHARSLRDGTLGAVRERSIAIAVRLPTPIRHLLLGAYRRVRRRRS